MPYATGWMYSGGSWDTRLHSPNASCGGDGGHRALGQGAGGSGKTHVTLGGERGGT